MIKYGVVTLYFGLALLISKMPCATWQQTSNTDVNHIVLDNNELCNIKRWAEEGVDMNSNDMNERRTFLGV